MDPQATWDQLLFAWTCQEWCDVYEHATALAVWPKRDGLPPTIIEFKTSIGKEVNTVLALTAWEFALATASANGWPLKSDSMEGGA